MLDSVDKVEKNGMDTPENRSQNRSPDTDIGKNMETKKYDRL